MKRKKPSDIETEIKRAIFQLKEAGEELDAARRSINELVKRKKPKDIVDRQVWRIAKLTAQLLNKPTNQQWEVAQAVEAAIAIMSEAQKQVDKDVSKGAEKSGL